MVNRTYSPTIQLLHDSNVLLLRHSIEMSYPSSFKNCRMVWLSTILLSFPMAYRQKRAGNALVTLTLTLTLTLRRTCRQKAFLHSEPQKHRDKGSDNVIRVTQAHLFRRLQSHFWAEQATSIVCSRVSLHDLLTTFSPKRTQQNPIFP